MERKSVAASYSKHVPVILPSILICLAKPYRDKKRISKMMIKEIYEQNTFSHEDYLKHISDEYLVKEVRTVFSGKCISG